jgi:hypothetical protein
VANKSRPCTTLLHPLYRHQQTTPLIPPNISIITAQVQLHSKSSVSSQRHSSQLTPPQHQIAPHKHIHHPTPSTMVAVIESVVAVSVFVTITAIMAAHHAEERLKQRFTKDGNKYHRFDQKVFRFQERLRGREPPSRHYCPNGHPLD